MTPGTKEDAVAQAVKDARRWQKTMAVRLTPPPSSIWYVQQTTTPIHSGDLEICTVQCDGRVEEQS